jgi:hypothetical protein
MLEIDNGPKSDVYPLPDETVTPGGDTQPKQLTRQETYQALIGIAAFLVIVTAACLLMHGLVTGLETAQQNKTGIFAVDTATPTPTREGEIHRVVQQDIHKLVTMSFDDPAHTQLTITSNVSDYQLTNGTTRNEIYLEADTTFRDLFTKHLGLQQVTIHWEGTVVDTYGNTSTAELGTATLTASTAQLFNWDTLGFGQAWQDYDHAQLFRGL